MSVQLGFTCFANAAAAAPAACAAFVPISSTTATVSTQTYCETGLVSGAPGAMSMVQVNTTISTGVATYKYYLIAPEFPSCVQGDEYVAMAAIFGLVLAAACLIWGVKQVLHLMRDRPEC